MTHTTETSPAPRMDRRLRRVARASGASGVSNVRGPTPDAPMGAAVKLERVVVGVDLRAPSMAAAAWCAKQLAPGAELILAHSLGPAGASDADEARQRAWQDLRTLREALAVERVRIVITEGDPAERMAEIAVDADADLVVVGAHGATSGPWDPLGSTAERLVRRSPVPVLLAAGELRHEPKRLLVPVRASDVTESVVAWARMLEARFDASLAIVHLVDLGPGEHASNDREYEAEPAGTALAPPGVARRWPWLAAGRKPSQVFAEAVVGEPAAGVLAEAKRFASDLIVLSVEPSDARLRVGADNMPARVLRGAPCPVLVLVDQGVH
jgi:nucleotide-binding universal stress UspA family protein